MGEPRYPLCVSRTFTEVVVGEGVALLTAALITRSDVELTQLAVAHQTLYNKISLDCQPLPYKDLSSLLGAVALT